MKKIYLRRTAKIIAFILCFIVVFFALNALFSDMYSTRVRSFYHMEKDSIDAIFFGPSQSYCAINAQKITEEYGISSFDFCADGQPLVMTYYYLREALKRQKPKVVGVEISKIFNTPVTAERIVYSYSAMPLTVEKYNSLKALHDGDKTKAFEWFIPLFANHSWWNQINPFLLVKDLLSDHSAEYLLRGFEDNKAAEPVEIEFLNGGGYGEIQQIPDYSIDALNDISELCRQNGIKLILFKTPVAADWTINDSKTVKEYMSENGFTFFDMNDNLDEIGIDPETDFLNKLHLNTKGANKTTDYLVRKLKSLNIF